MYTYSLGSMAPMHRHRSRLPCLLPFCTQPGRVHPSRLLFLSRPAPNSTHRHLSLDGRFATHLPLRIRGVSFADSNGEQQSKRLVFSTERCVGSDVTEYRGLGLSNILVTIEIVKSTSKEQVFIGATESPAKLLEDRSYVSNGNREI